MANTWWTYVQARAGEVHQKDIAIRLGVNPTTVSRWAREGAPSPEKVINFARVTGRPPVEALVAAGYLRADEADEAIEVGTSLEDVDDNGLLDELRRRLMLAAAYRAGSPAADLVTESKGLNLFVTHDPHDDVVVTEEVLTERELPAAARRGGQSEGRQRRKQQDDAAEAPE